MEKSDFKNFVEKRNNRFEEIYKELFEDRETNNPNDISLIQISAFARANDELLFEVLKKD
ncbi:hypothetical protein K4T79_02760 [Staphylococcus epidermidis]|nr:hypothetical protein [Staphylococcus epidermidis]MCG2547359.1 hypothetical protein [Staphylococcus epidermidis]